MFSPLRERNYRLWAAADFVSVGGTWMQVLGLNWLVLSATGSATAMGVIVMLQSLPVLVLGTWGGALADRLPARPVLLISQAIRAVLSVALVLATVSDATSLWPVYAVALLSGVISSVEGPALGRFGSQLVPRDSLAPALALGSVLGSGGRIVGMALGGVLVGTTGPAALFAINAVSFGAVIISLVMMRLAEAYPLAKAEKGTADAGVVAGLRYLLSQPVVLVVLALAFVLGSLGRNYQVTMAAMVAGPLDGGAGGYGFASTIFAIGAVTGGLLLAATGKASLKVLLGAGLVISVLQLCSGLAPGLPTFVVLVAPIAAGAVIFDTVVSTRLQLDTREDMRGRVLASLGLVSSLAGIVGAPGLGWLSDTLGARGALVLAGTVTTVAALIGVLVLARVKGRTLPGLGVAFTTVRRALPLPSPRRVTTAVIPTDTVVPAQPVLTAAAVVAAPLGSLAPVFAPVARPLTAAGVARAPEGSLLPASASALASGGPLVPAQAAGDSAPAELLVTAQASADSLRQAPAEPLVAAQAPADPLVAAQAPADPLVAAQVPADSLIAAPALVAEHGPTRPRFPRPGSPRPGTAPVVSAPTTGHGPGDPGRRRRLLVAAGLIGRRGRTADPIRPSDQAALPPTMFR